MSVIWGIILLLIYDVLRIFRGIVKHHALGVALEDIIFWCVSGLMIFVMMYQQNNGTIRGFSIVAMVIGMTIYHYSVSDFLVRNIIRLLHAVFGGINKTIKVTFGPFAKLVSFLRKIIKKIKKYVAKQLKKTAKTVKIGITKK
jgi:Spore cortex protein YabQ (Spore_YabQ).